MTDDLDLSAKEKPQRKKSLKKKEPARKAARAVANENSKALVDNLQAELDDARLEGAGNRAARCRVVDAAGGGKRAAEAAGGQVKIGVVEDVVEFGA